MCAQKVSWMQLKAIALAQAVTTINLSKDSQTTVSGNQNTGEVIQLAQATAQQISQMVLIASVNLQSFAKEFTALDQQINQSIALSSVEKRQ